jgi:hypothetical protein
MTARTRIGLALAALLCTIGWLRHRVRREPHCFRCEACGKAGADLDAFEKPARQGDAYVTPGPRKSWDPRLYRGRGRA